MTSHATRSSGSDLQGWYESSLLPKLTGAASAGIVEAAAVASFDRLIRDLLDLPATDERSLR